MFGQTGVNRTPGARAANKLYSYWEHHHEPLHCGLHCNSEAPLSCSTYLLSSSLLSCRFPPLLLSACTHSACSLCTSVVLTDQRRKTDPDVSHERRVLVFSARVRTWAGGMKYIHSLQLFSSHAEYGGIFGDCFLSCTHSRIELLLPQTSLWVTWCWLDLTRKNMSTGCRHAVSWW